MFIKKILTSFFSVLALFAFTATQANAITIDPAFLIFNFDNPNVGDDQDLAVRFGFNRDGTGGIDFELNLNEEAGTASIFFDDLGGRIFAADDLGRENSLAEVSLDLAFTWTGIVQEGDSLVLREPTGAGAVASLSSDLFGDQDVQFTLGAAGTTNSEIFPADADNPVFFYLGPDGVPTYTEGDLNGFSTWFAANTLVTANGITYNVRGDLHGSSTFNVGGANFPTDTTEVPEPATMLLLGSGILGGALRKKKKA